MFKIKAYAKVNLYLRVLCRRRDGFHELETVFERLDLHDSLILRPASSEMTLTVSGRKLPTDTDNLIVRAALLLKRRYRVRKGARIHLTKRIPVAAGLAGGSSDAAAALTGLNRLWRLGLSRRSLLGHAAELGSDVAFFVLNTPYALGRGRGERLTPLRSRLRMWHVLVTPPLALLTRKVYGYLKPRFLAGRRPDAKLFVSRIRRADYPGLRNILFNTLELVVRPRYPVIERLQTDLFKAGLDAPILSGSGPTVFGVTLDEKTARRAARIVKKKYPRSHVVVARTV